MPWSKSAMFRQYTADALLDTVNFVPNLAAGGTWKAALFNNVPSPDNTVTAANSAYGAGQWLAAREVIDTVGANWVAGGTALAFAVATRWAASGDHLVFDADDTVSAGVATIAGAYGCLVYDDSLAAPGVADQGLAFHYFGGPQGADAGLFTIVWHPGGVARWNLTAV